MNRPTGAGSNAPEFLIVEESEAPLRVDRKTLYESIRREQAPGVVHVGKSLRVRRNALLSWTPGNSSPANGKKP